MATKKAAKKAVKKAAKTTRQAVAKKATAPKKVGAKPLEGHDKSLDVIKPKKKSK
jgi:hypothetical protein